MCQGGRRYAREGGDEVSEMFYHYQKKKNVLCFGSSVYLWETQARAMMCAACSTHVCFCPYFTPRSAGLCSKSLLGFFFYSAAIAATSLLLFLLPPASHLSFLPTHRHYIAIPPIPPSVLLSVVVNCVRRGASSSLYRLPSGQHGRRA